MGKTTANRRQVIVGTTAALLTMPLSMSTARVLAQVSGQLVIAFIPQENLEKQNADVKAITAWLSSAIKTPVRGFVTENLAAAVEALQSREADVSFMGALPYVVANQKIGAEIVLSEIYRGKPGYSGRIFVRRNGPIRKLADLKGKAIAFSDPLSESGYLYPLDLFVEQGLLQRDEAPERFFGRVFFAGGYQQAIQAVADGHVDAAGASQYADLLLSPEQQAEVHWIAESPQIPSHGVVVRKGLAVELREKFVAAMMRLNVPKNRHLLKHVYNPDGYVAPDTAAYDGVRKLATAYGLLK
ncbi:MAG: phosphate/phosphite/phosphonate ABC transporter substrate-binding protein [Hyphomicrobiaceae bacterium]